MLKKAPNSQINAPFPWMGGKVRMRSKIVPYFDLAVPEPELYCEPFGGSGAMFYAIKKNWKEVYNDSNSLLVNCFRRLRDPASRAKIKELCEVTPYSREIYGELKGLALDYLNGRDVDLKAYLLDSLDVETAVAFAFFYCQNAGFGGDFMGAYGGVKFAAKGLIP